MQSPNNGGSGSSSRSSRAPPRSPRSHHGALRTLQQQQRQQRPTRQQQQQHPPPPTALDAAAPSPASPTSTSTRPAAPPAAAAATRGKQSSSQSSQPGAPSNSSGSGSGSASSNVRVVARIRPPTEQEVAKGGGSDVCCLSVPTAQTVEISLSDEWGGLMETAQAFAFDRVLGPTEGQEAVFEAVAKPLVDDVLAGYNGTIFAYGQTSSGKTYTMEGDAMDVDARGIIPRAVAAVFEGIAGADAALEFTLKVSYVEIYMERIRDLLDPFKTKTNLQVREDARGQVYVAGVTEAYVTSEAELLTLMIEGQKNRAVAATGMNEGSSRSHSVFLLTITQRDVASPSPSRLAGGGRSSKLTLVDLAGSELVRKTGAAGQQLEEAKTINKSLSALGLVITALTEGRGRGGNNTGGGGTHSTAHFVPYRDSKLTRMLQDALGGNSKLALIINLSPSPWNANETLSTLRFGSRATGIQNRAVVNEARGPEEMALLLAKAEKSLHAQHALIQSLEAQLNRYMKASGHGHSTLTSTLALGTTLGSTMHLASTASASASASARRPSFAHTQRTTALVLAATGTAAASCSALASETHPQQLQQQRQRRRRHQRGGSSSLSLGSSSSSSSSDASAAAGGDDVAGRPGPEETARATALETQEWGDESDDIAAIPSAPTTTTSPSSSPPPPLEADVDVIGLLEKQLGEARAELEEEREEGRRKEEETRALAQIARDETAALVEAQAAIQALEAALRAREQEAEEAAARHAFELQQARLHAQRCEAEQGRLSGELEEMGQRLAAAAAEPPAVAVAVAEEGEGDKDEDGEQRLAAAAGHIRLLEEKLQALVESHRLVVRRHRGLEGELAEARAQTGLWDERIAQLEGTRSTLEQALRRQEERHMAELAALREQALRVAGVARGSEGGEGPWRLGSTFSFGAVAMGDDDGGGSCSSSGGSPRRPASTAASAAAVAAALLGSTLGLTTSSLGMSMTASGGPRTIRGGTKASLADTMSASTTKELAQQQQGALSTEAEAGAAADAGILSRLRDGILGSILASPL